MCLYLKNQRLKRKFLVEQLRQFLINQGSLAVEVVEAYWDDEIIKIFNTCSKCGDSIVNADTLEKLIRISKDAKDFIYQLSLINKH